jgi:hypothetical protein
MRSKEPSVTPSVFADIEEVRCRVQEWRRRRKHGSRIPEALWISAVKLAKKHRPARVAHALGLDYYALKQRLNTANKHDTSEREAKPTFIELLPGTLASHCECTIEIEHRRGAKMKLQLKGVSAGDLAAVSRALWSAGR